MDTFGLAEGHPEPISSKTRNIVIEVETRCMPRDDTQVHDTYHNQRNQGLPQVEYTTKVSPVN